MSPQRFDIAVIGAGSGGLTVAAAAAQFGQRVVLFEQGDMGGDCLNAGCVPSKALLAAAKRAQAMRDAGRFGIRSAEPEIDFAAVMDHVRRSIAAIAPNDSQERFEKLGVKVVRAAARFCDPSSIAAAGEVFTARRAVIATGSRPAVPPIPGLGSVAYLTNETLFALKERPRHLVIIGGGPIGLELAQAFRRLGSEVTVIEAQQALGRDDPELAAVALARLRAEGIVLRERMNVAEVSKGDAGIAVRVEGGAGIEGSHLLIATGRKPNVENLGLSEAGIAFTQKGVTVDRGLRTTNRRVYAVGDVAGGPMFTHAAGYHGGLVVRNALFGLPVRASTAMPRVTFTDPELAQAGLTEAEARAAHGGSVAVLRWPFRDNDRAQTEADTAGLVKVVTGRRGRILGAGIAGPEAGELIQPWILAIDRGLSIGAMTGPVLPYPTRGEANRRAAISAYSNYASHSLVRGVIRIVSALIP